jgi:phospholipase C
MRARRRSGHSAPPLAVLVSFALLIPALPGALAEEAQQDSRSTFAAPIDHVVFILMENHAYDSYFETYCLTLGPYCNDTANGIPPGTCEPQLNVSGGCVVPRSFKMDEVFWQEDLCHAYGCTVRSIDGGKMDGFYTAEGSTTDTFGHYNGSTLPIYWDIAQEYSIGDDFFSSALAFSLPNHWYALAGKAPPQGINASGLFTVSGRHEYLNQANRTRTVQDLLNGTSVSWRYYDWNLDRYSRAINLPVSLNTPGSAYSYFNPLAARAESYTRWYDQHFVNRNTFFTDVSDGQLPNVSWVIPDANYSDHPTVNLTRGEAFVANVVDAVERSAYWYHTVIFLAWDDYGGYYDHVAPPRLDPLGLSVRVPFIVISPYTPAGRVVHSQGYFESTLAFIEHRWKLGCLTDRDCDAPTLLNYFDFSMTPRAPISFDPNYLTADYPMRGQYGGVLDSTSWVGDDAGLNETDAD